jgi:uncharacterized membrane protein YgcG
MDIESKTKKTGTNTKGVMLSLAITLVIVGVLMLSLMLCSQVKREVSQPFVPLIGESKLVGALEMPKLSQSVFSVQITAEGWEESFGPFRLRITGVGADCVHEYEVIPNEPRELTMIIGTYTFEVIAAPMAEDGTTYELPEAQSVEWTAKEDVAVVLVCTLKPVAPPVAEESGGEGSGAGGATYGDSSPVGGGSSAGGNGNSGGGGSGGTPGGGGGEERLYYCRCGQSFTSAAAAQAHIDYYYNLYMNFEIDTIEPHSGWYY